MARANPDLEYLRPQILALSEALAEQIQTFYTTPIDEHVDDNDRVFAVLNALAHNAGMVLAGTGPDERAIEFFTQALARTIGEAFNMEKMKHGNPH
jgi:hypothetical protein